MEGEEEDSCPAVDIEETPPPSDGEENEEENPSNPLFFLPLNSSQSIVDRENQGTKRKSSETSSFLDEYVITQNSNGNGRVIATPSTYILPTATHPPQSVSKPSNNNQQKQTKPKAVGRQTKKRGNSSDNNNNNNNNNSGNLTLNGEPVKKRTGRPKKNDMNEVEDDKGSRSDSSLGMLTKKFTDLVRSDKAGTIDLNDAAKELGVQKRRIYDITNVLEGINLIEKKSKNVIHWRGSGLCTPEERKKIQELKIRIDELKKQEALEDEKTRKTQLNLKQIVEESKSQFAFITHDDVRNLPGMENQTLIAIKAPSGTRLEVPDPDEGMNGGERRYQIFLQSENGAAIDVYLVSSDRLDTTYQEANEDGGRTEESNHHNNVLEDPPIDPSGLLRITHAPETDYYFNSMMDGEGISDFYNEENQEIFIG